MRGRKRFLVLPDIRFPVHHIKKESPNEGTETKKIDIRIDEITDNDKKRIPE